MRHESLPTRKISEDIARAFKRCIWAASAVVVAVGWLNEISLQIPLLSLADAQTSLANWIEPILLVFAAALFFITSRAARATTNIEAQYWRGLSILFVFLSLDEALNLHELAGLFLVLCFLSAAALEWSSFRNTSLRTAGLIRRLIVSPLAPKKPWRLLARLCFAAA